MFYTTAQKTKKRAMYLATNTTPNPKYLNLPTSVIMDLKNKPRQTDKNKT